jgi:hypothetical protein
MQTFALIHKILKSCLAPLVAAAALSSAAVQAQDSRGEPGVVPSDPVFVALTADGGTAAGRIRRIAPDGAISLVTVEGPERSIPLESLVKLSSDGINAPLTPEASVVLFPDGDRLYRATIAAAGETALEVQSFALGNLSVPLDSILGLVLTLPAEPEQVGPLIQRVRGEKRSSEVLWLANGDRLTGGLLGLTEKSVEFQPAKAPVKLDRSGVVALGFDPSNLSYPKPDRGFFEVTVSDGSRLGLTAVRLEQGYVHGTTRFGANLRIPLAELRRLSARTNSVVYLTDRPVAAEKYIPYVGPTRPFQRDATVEGHPIRLAGQDYERGIGTQSRTLLAYRLEKGDRRFQATVGVDDRAGPLGSVVFRVLTDNKERFASPPLSAHDAPRPIDLDVSDAKTLILITEFGERGGVRDLADWAEARIIR